MHRIDLNYSLGSGNGTARIHNPLIALLQAVAREGSISAAARALSLSYRHVWGELKRWEQQLGGELLVWEKGQAARLSEFGSKLMWAEQQAQARLAPQIESLRADLERAFAVAFDDSAHVVTFYASHDAALARLRQHALHLGQGEGSGHETLHLDIRFTGSVDAISALNEGRCSMAGFHTRQQPARGTLAEHTYKPLLKPGLHKIIGFAERTQGLIVAPGNPLGINCLQDLARLGARYANRALGTGTRLLFDELLADAGLQSSAINDYANTETSHDAVAHAVAAGLADAGLAIKAAAQAVNLGFVPLLRERYHLVCLKSALNEPGITALLALLASPEWQHELAQLAGYNPAQSGEVLSMRRMLPWWDYARKK